MPVEPTRRLLGSLGEFVDRFAGCFGREAQRHACRTYVAGLLSSAERKSIQSMLAGRADAEYQRVQHFIAHAPWDHRALWKVLRKQIPENSGVLVIDDTGFHKQGIHSVGVARQYCPPLGKVANCQVAVTTILRSEKSTWPLAMDLYVPHEWDEDEGRREGALIPRSVRFRKKWEIAVAQATAHRLEGFRFSGVTADAGYGDITEFRDRLTRMRFRFVVRVGGSQIAFRGKPRLVRRLDRGGSSRMEVAPGSPKPTTLKDLAKRLPESDFKTVKWGHGSRGPMRVRVTALRVALCPDWKDGRPVRKPCWLLVRRKEDGTHKIYLSNLPETAPLIELVRIAYSRWAVEQNYQQLKDDLGLDHFEGRSWPAWNHHAAVTAMAFTFLALERRRSRKAPLPTVPALRRVLSKLLLAMTFVEDPELRGLVASFGRDPPPF